MCRQQNDPTGTVRAEWHRREVSERHPCPALHTPPAHHAPPDPWVFPWSPSTTILNKGYSRTGYLHPNIRHLVQWIVLWYRYHLAIELATAFGVLGTTHIWRRRSRIRGLEWALYVLHVELPLAKTWMQEGVAAVGEAWTAPALCWSDVRDLEPTGRIRSVDTGVR
jgi:hypothetical protein